MEPSIFQWRSFMVVLFGVGVLTALIFLPYFGVIVLAAAIAVLFEPIYHKLAYVFPKRTGIAALVTVLLILVVIIAPLAYFGIQIVQEAGNLYNHLAQYAHGNAPQAGGGEALVGLHQHLPHALGQFVPTDTEGVASIARAALGWVVGRLGGIFGKLTSIFLDFILMLIAVYYLLKDGRKFAAKLTFISPLDPKHDAMIGNKVYATVNSVVKGTLLLAILQGVIAGAGFLIFGVPNPTLLGAATVIAALVPVVGTFLTLGPAIIYLFAFGHIAAALGLTVWAVLVVGLVDNFLRPHLMMRQGVDIHPFLILLSVLGGLSFFGAVGFITGPLVLSIFLALLDIYTTHIRPSAPAGSAA